MQVNLGSQNPAKILAVTNVFRPLYKTVDVVSIDISGIKQPKSFYEMLIGANKRALNSHTPGSIYCIGLESGIFPLEIPWSKTLWFNTNCCVIYNPRNKEKSCGFSSCFPLPKKIADKLKQGKELSDVVDDLEFKNAGHIHGLINALSKETKNRTKLMEEAVLSALLPMINPELYQKP